MRVNLGFLTFHASALSPGTISRLELLSYMDFITLIFGKYSSLNLRVNLEFLTFHASALSPCSISRLELLSCMDFITLIFGKNLNTTLAFDRKIRTFTRNWTSNFLFACKCAHHYPCQTPNPYFNLFHKWISR